MFFIIDFLLHYITSMTCIILLLVLLLILSNYNSSLVGEFTKSQNIGEDYKIAVEQLHTRLSFYAEVHNMLIKIVSYSKGMRGIIVFSVLIMFATLSMFVKSVWILTVVLLLTGIYRLLMQYKTVQDFVIALDYSLDK